MVLDSHPKVHLLFSFVPGLHLSRTSTTPCSPHASAPAWLSERCFLAKPLERAPWPTGPRQNEQARIYSVDVCQTLVHKWKEDSMVLSSLRRALLDLVWVLSMEVVPYYMEHC